MVEYAIICSSFSLDSYKYIQYLDNCLIYVSFWKLTMLQARVSLLNCSKACLIFSLFSYDRKERVVGK